MELVHPACPDSETVVARFAKLAGYDDPIIGRERMPKSLRAKYGKDFYENAVHCTAHVGRGLEEVEFFFKR